VIAGVFKCLRLLDISLMFGSNKKLPKNQVQKLTDKQSAVAPPEIGKPYMVEAPTFRCLAVFGENGKWMVYSTGMELTEVINYSPLS